jgi:hypothetical protein
VNKNETEYQNALLLLVPKRIHDLRLWRRNISFVRVEERSMRSGIKGQADIYGYWRAGFGIEIELKSLRGVTTTEQFAWEAFCRSWNIGYLRLRPLRTETSEQTLNRWVQEIERLRPSSRL